MKMSETTNKNMMSCPTCGTEIAKSAKVCPSCGAKIKKPWYKKWWVWVLIVIIVAGIGGGSQSGKSKETPSVSTDTANANTDSTPSVSSGENVNASESDSASESASDSASESANTADTQADTSAEEDTLVAEEPIDTVLWENDGIKVIYKGIERDYMGIDIKVLVENNSSTDKRVSLNSIDVNGYSINSALSLYATVNAGKKTNDSITLYNSSIRDNGINGIDDIESIEMVFKCYDSENYNSVESSPVTLTF
jgi:hypothetical protein